MIEHNPPDDIMLRRLHAGDQTLFDGGYSHEWFVGLLAHLQRSNSRDLKSTIRTLLAQHVRNYTRNFDNVPTSGNSQIESMYGRLNKVGYAHFKIHSRVVDRIVKSLYGTTMSNHDNGSQIVFSPEFSLAPRSFYSTSHSNLTTNILRFAEITNLAQNDLILELTRRYLGALPRLVHFEFSLNQSGKLGPIPSSDWHLDKDCISFLKIFIYLNNISLENGPHAYVPGSHDEGNVRAAVARQYPNDAGVADILLNGQRWKPQTVDKVFPRKQFSHCGPAGLAIVEDTRGLHVAKPPVKGHRLMITLEYALDPYILIAPPEPLSFTEIPDSVRPQTGDSEMKFNYVFASFLKNFR